MENNLQYMLNDWFCVMFMMLGWHVMFSLFKEIQTLYLDTQPKSELLLSYCSVMDN